MGTFEVYRHPVEQKYRATYCSFAAIFQLFTFALTVICPLLVAYRSQGFWLKTNTYEEQPDVHFLHQFIIVLTGRYPEEYLVWSSFDQLNEMEQERLRVPVIKSRPLDTNRDGKADGLSLSAEFPLGEEEEIRGVQALLFYSYNLDLYSQFQVGDCSPLDTNRDGKADGLSLSAEFPLGEEEEIRGVQALLFYSYNLDLYSQFEVGDCSPLDTNRDGKADGLSLSAEFPLGEEEEIRGVQALLFYSYNLDLYSQFQVGDCSPLDTNRDGKADGLSLSAEFPLGEEEEIRGVQALLFYSYNLDLYSQFQVGDCSPLDTNRDGKADGLSLSAEFPLGEEEEIRGVQALLFYSYNLDLYSQFQVGDCSPLDTNRDGKADGLSLSAEFPLGEEEEIRGVQALLFYSYNLDLYSQFQVGDCSPLDTNRDGKADGLSLSAEFPLGEEEEIRGVQALLFYSYNLDLYSQFQVGDCSPLDTNRDGKADGLSLSAEFPLGEEEEIRGVQALLFYSYNLDLYSQFQVGDCSPLDTNRDGKADGLSLSAEFPLGEEEEIRGVQDLLFYSYNLDLYSQFQVGDCSPLDTNRDGKADGLSLSAEFPLGEEEEIRGVQALLFYSYNLDLYSQFQVGDCSPLDTNRDGKADGLSLSAEFPLGEEEEIRGVQALLFYSYNLDLYSQFQVGDCSPLDTNRDGKADGLSLSAEFPLGEEEEIRGVQALLFYSYNLDLYSQFQMTGMISISENSAVSSKDFQLSGDMRLFQRTPLWYRSHDRRWARHPVNTSNWDGSPRLAKASDFRLDTLRSDYADRDVSLRLENKDAHWKPAPPGDRPFTVTLKFAVPTETVRYYAGFWELIKWGWVQYLAILAIFVLIFGALRRFVFQNRLVLTIPQKLKLL